MNYTYNCYWGHDWGFEWALLQSEIRAGYVRFLNRIAPQDLNPNPLPILMRSVNSRFAMLRFKNPRWRAGRWGSKT